MKKLVKYNTEYSAIIEVGRPAIVRPIDHTSELVSNTKHVMTSLVLRFDKKSGEFETENSIYRPA